MQTLAGSPHPETVPELGVHVASLKMRCELMRVANCWAIAGLPSALCWTGGAAKLRAVVAVSQFRIHPLNSHVFTDCSCTSSDYVLGVGLTRTGVLCSLPYTRRPFDAAERDYAHQTEQNGAHTDWASNHF